MKIAIDARVLTKRFAGIGNYVYLITKELVALRSDCTFYLFAAKVTDEIASLGKHPNVKICTEFRYNNALFWYLFGITFLCKKHQPDILWGCNQLLPLFKTKNTKYLLTVHDFTHLLYPKTMQWQRRFFLRFFSKNMLRAANQISAVSTGTKEKLFSYYQKKAQIISPPIRKFQKLTSKKQIAYLNELNIKPGAFLFTLGTVEPRKGFDGLIQFYSKLLANKKNPHPLVISGQMGWKFGNWIEKIKKLQAKYPQKIIFTGYLEDWQLSTLYENASYFICNSLYEGYGMPIAEAKSHGTKIICPNQMEMKEAAKFEGIFFESVEDLLNSDIFYEKPKKKKTSVSYPDATDQAKLYSKLMENM